METNHIDEGIDPRAALSCTGWRARVLVWPVDAGLPFSPPSHTQTDRGSAWRPADGSWRSTSRPIIFTVPWKSVHLPHAGGLHRVRARIRAGVALAFFARTPFLPDVIGRTREYERGCISACNERVT